MLFLAERRKQSLLSGAVVLAVSAIVVKVMGLIYKIPLTALIGEVGRGYFSAAYNIFTPIYAVSMAGLPVAVTGMVSRNMALGRYKQTKKIFGAALAMFSFTGIAGTALLLLLAYPYSFWLIRSPETFKSIVMIAPSVLFCCVMAAYRAYFEGLGNMIPTALSEVVESFTKMGFGILLAFLVMRCGMESFNSSGTVFGAQAASGRKPKASSFPGLRRPP